MNGFTSLQETTLKQADRCVKCGLCSAQCPTYRISGSENESPRGRVALAQALASEQLNDTTLAEKHLNNCLTCQRCEKVCPSGVDFSEIMANSRAILVSSQNQKEQPNKFKLVKWASKRTHGDWKKITKVTGILKKLGALHLIPTLAPLHRHISVSNKKSIERPPQKKKSAVSLFTGCTSHILDSKNLDNAKELLTLCGYEVSTPDDQVCCGALPRHKGLLASSKQCEADNLTAFNKDDAIVFLATACGAVLKRYENNTFTARTSNITAFLNDENALAALSLKPLNKRVLIHEPCSEKNALKETGHTQRLLSNIPNIDIITLKETTSCCGAAGDYMLTHSQNANKIREVLIKDIDAIAPDIIVTTNYTCGIHIKNGLLERFTDKKTVDIAVVHPIQLILDQIT